MKALFIILMAVSFAPPAIFGHIGAPFWTAVVWSAVISAETVFGGWRAPKGGIVGSLLVGTGFAALWCIPTFFVGKML